MAASLGLEIVVWKDRRPRAQWGVRALRDFAPREWICDFLLSQWQDGYSSLDWAVDIRGERWDGDARPGVHRRVRGFDG